MSKMNLVYNNENIPKKELCSWFMFYFMKQAAKALR